MRSSRSHILGCTSASQIGTAVRASVEQLESRVLLSTSVLHYRYDTMSTGVNDSEVGLSPSNVKNNSFGKLYSVALDGQVYAEPLVQTDVMISAGVNTTSGAAGVHDVAFVCTENDTIYAVDTSSGQILWQRSFLGTANNGGNINNTMGATSISIVTSADVGVPDVSPTIGITSTPVIDADTGILYVLAKTKEVVGGLTYFAQRLHAINTSDGTDVVTPYTIGATTNNNVNTTQIYAYGSGDGSVVDPYNNTKKPVVQFNAFREFNRVALSLVNNTIYIAWASHGDYGPYHGWVVTWNVANITTSGFQLSGVLCTSPNDGNAGVWQSGGSISFESDGSAFYFMTGNGTGGAPTLNSAGFPNNANYGEAVIKAVTDPTTSPMNQGPNGWGLKVVDYFIPYNVAAMDAADSDFGSGGPLLLPDSAGIPGHPNLLVAGGKDGRLYVLDRNNLGHYTATGDPNALNSVKNASGQLTPPNVISGTLSTPTWFNGHLYATAGYNGHAREFSINSAGQLVTTSQSASANLGFESGGPIISGDDSADGIVWVPDRQTNALHAFDAGSLSTELWNSNGLAGNQVGAVEKFAEPTVANGEVFVGTTNSLVAYGLAQTPSAAPSAPVLSATTTSGSSINLTWTDPSMTPNVASVYKIDESSNGSPFTQVATAPAGATSIGIGGLQPLTQYSFQIVGVNSVGASSPSNPATATTTTQAAVVDFSSGFSGSTNLTLNGHAVVQATNLQLTDGKNNESSSAFYNTPVSITNFTSQFSFQIGAGTNTADGFTFTIQNQSAKAIGMAGWGLGYSDSSSTSHSGIDDGVAIKFDLFSNDGEGSDSTGLYENGEAPEAGPNSTDLSGTPINLHSGDLFNVNLAYDGTTLSETITDTTTSKSITENYTVNLAQVIGSSSAYVGFTAGTGGASAVQKILNWTYSPSASTSPIAPSGLGAAPATAMSVGLVWTNNATNQTGYTLQRATDPGFTQNVVTEMLPAFPATFTDTMTGLAPGSTYYYQLSAFNSAGPSGYSNAASVTIPLAPPTPTNQSITNVTTNEIDITWQDNAGHSANGYNILRQVNNGAFTVVASLPPTSRAAPSQYSWSDTSVKPGNLYGYEIEAVNTSGFNNFAAVSATTVTAAPSPAATAGNGSVTLSWPAVQGATTYNVYRGSTPGGESATPIATGITGTSFKDTSVTNGAGYYYQVTAVNSNGSYTPPLPSESAKSKELSATPSIVVASPGLFANTLDIGSPALAGSAKFANGTYTLTAGGTDIWKLTDQFRYDYQNVTGNTTIAATVMSVSKTNAWAKAAVMIRATTAANSPFADIVVTPGGYVAFQWRLVAGGGCYQYVMGAKPPAQTVKLVRVGNTFTAYFSNKGVWTRIGSSVTINMGTSATVGLAACSVNPAARTTATFTNVSLTGTTSAMRPAR